ncbi:MAG: class I SAM-dependent methyltransferase [Gemmatimonadetes bacterium]|nr:class I SAM-dependent methyltransferase [Gemmatimonadota bacterium]
MQFSEILIASYENHARERESSASNEFKEQEKHEFRKYLRSERRNTILELGCGPGHDARFFQKQGFQILAIDAAPTMVQLAKQKGVNARILDCYDLDQMVETFDAVYSMNCLLHIPQNDILHILDLISARLNEGGLLYLGLWGGEDFEGIWEKDRYEPKRFFSFRKTETLLGVVHQSFEVEYFRRIEARKGMFFNSLISRKR